MSKATVIARDFTGTIPKVHSDVDELENFESDFVPDNDGELSANDAFEVSEDEDLEEMGYLRALSEADMIERRALLARIVREKNLGFDIESELAKYLNIQDVDLNQVVDQIISEIRADQAQGNDHREGLRKVMSMIQGISDPRRRLQVLKTLMVGLAMGNDVSGLEAPEAAMLSAFVDEIRGTIYEIEKIEREQEEFVAEVVDEGGVSDVIKEIEDHRSRMRSYQDEMNDLFEKVKSDYEARAKEYKEVHKEFEEGMGTFDQIDKVQERRGDVISSYKESVAKLGGQEAINDLEIQLLEAELQKLEQSEQEQGLSGQESESESERAAEILQRIAEKKEIRWQQWEEQTDKAIEFFNDVLVTVGNGAKVSNDVEVGDSAEVSPDMEGGLCDKAGVDLDYALDFLNGVLGSLGTDVEEEVDDEQDIIDDVALPSTSPLASDNVFKKVQNREPISGTPRHSVMVPTAQVAKARDMNNVRGN